MITALGMLSGGLDSILAIRLLQEQKKLRVEAVSFATPFFGPGAARTAAAQLGVKLHVIDITDIHFAMVKNPRHGYGKNMNPCIDCHAMMFREAGKLLERIGGPGFLFSGEVLGERPMSQNRQSLQTVARASGCADRILRPLSAKLLEPTQPEIAGLVDRELLLDLQGRSRKPQMALAKKWGITQYPNPGGGCKLTDPLFSRRLRDLLDHAQHIERADLELLNVGRHLRIRPDLKIVVGRNEAENSRIEELARPTDILFSLEDIPGPTVIIPGRAAAGEDRLLAARICLTFTGARHQAGAGVTVTAEGQKNTLQVSPLERSEVEDWIL